MYDDADMRIMTLNVEFNGRDDTQGLGRSTTYITNLINTNQPTVIGFQEYAKGCYSTIGTAISNDYDVAFSKHTDENTVIYTPIYYRKDTLELVDAGGGWLDSRYEGTNTKSYSWAVLKFKDTGKIFAVTNYHGAVVGTNYEEYKDWTKEQLVALQQEWTADNVRQLFDIIASIKFEHGDIPVVCVGDFNFNNTTPAYAKAIAGGLVEAETHATVSKRPGYRTTHEWGTAARYGASIDHIFYYPESVTAYVHYVGATTEDELCASDHLMVYADIGFNS